MDENAALAFLPSPPAPTPPDGTVQLVLSLPAHEHDTAVFFQLYRNEELYAEQHRADGQGVIFLVRDAGTYTGVVWTAGGTNHVSSVLFVLEGMLATPYPKGETALPVTPSRPFWRRWLTRKQSTTP